MKIINVEYDKSHTKGWCDTCNYGANYTNFITLYYDNEEKDEIEFNNSCNYVMSEWDLIQLVINFKDRNTLKDKLEEIANKEGAKLYINHEKISIGDDENYENQY